MSGLRVRLTLKQASAHLGPKPGTIQHQIYDERGLGHRLGAMKPGRDWLVDVDAVNVEAAKRGRPAHEGDPCAVCVDAGLNEAGL